MSIARSRTSGIRRTHRISAALKTIVQVKESIDVGWKEVTAVTTVSRNGAGFTLSRKCEVGRLVSLVLPMPDDLRAYDLQEELYTVLGLVQHCNEVNVDGRMMYNIGVGFIGKEIPESFIADPKQNYRFCGMTEDGLWRITEVQSAFKARKKPRFWRSIPLTLSTLKKGKDESEKESVKTKDISSSGFSVPCALKIGIGDKVKVASTEHDFYAVAEVRNRIEAKDDGHSPTLHLQFVVTEFPMQKVVFGNALSPDRN